MTPIVIDGRSYVGLDLGIDGRPFPDRRTGLMTLYGLDVRLDSRFLVGFARDISMLSEDDVARLSPPTAVSEFPSGLVNPDLEYSGVYEDGWISEVSFFGLAQPDAPVSMVVRGMVPRIDDPSFTTELRVLVDGQELARQVLRLGEFELRAPVADGEGRRRVELRFSKFQQLPAPDGRPAAALIRSVGFEQEPVGNASRR